MSQPTNTAPPQHRGGSDAETWRLVPQAQRDGAVTEGVTAWATHPWVAERAATVRFGIAYGPQWQSIYQPPVPRRPWLAFVQAVEDLGFDSYWLFDHPAVGHDCWTHLAAAAATTRRIQLGSLASCVFYRSPALLARLVSDVDHLSEGRLVLGLGTGDHDAEFATLGLPLPTPRERREALDETLQVLGGLWGEAPVSLDGRHFRVAGFRVGEGTVRRPRPPLLIAGGGERVILRRVAEQGDMSNFGAHPWTGSAGGAEDVARKWAVLREHCAAVGRPYESVLRSHIALPVVVRATPAEAQEAFAGMPERVRTFWLSGALVGGVDEARDQYRALRAAGFQYFVAGVYGFDLETVRLLAERVAPAVAG